MFFQLSNAFWRSLDPTVPDEIDRKLREVPTPLNEYGYDPWGYSPAIARYAYALGWAFYRHWFRVVVEGAQHIPAGRAIIACNHSGVVPFDALMVAMAMLLEADPPRLARGMAERFFPAIPFVSPLMQRMGHVLGDPQNCRELLEREEAILVFPEGVRGIGKTIFEAYELQEFGTGFVRLALESGAPVVPCAVVGAEEQMPTLVFERRLSKVVGLPYVPITPFFPALGPLGLVPLPVRYRIYFDEPVHFDGDARHCSDDEIHQHVELIKARVLRLVEQGLQSRPGVFA